MNHSGMLDFAIETAKQAGSILMQHFGNISNVDRKSTDIDLLTIADTESEAFILDRIKVAYPQHHIIAEESNLAEVNSDYTWVIDPLDGTTCLGCDVLREAHRRERSAANSGAVMLQVNEDLHS